MNVAKISALRFRFTIGLLALLLRPGAQAGSPTPSPTSTPPFNAFATSIEVSNLLPTYAPDQLDKALKPKVVVMLDSSGSMAQPLDRKKSKMYFAKRLFGSYLQDQYREKAQVGLLVYGSRRKHDCKDYYMAVPFGENSLPKIDHVVRGLGPTGMTPIADSLELAIKQLKSYPGPKRVMIFTDGEETCNGDPCKILQKAIEEKVLDLEMYVTGIGMSDKSKDLDNLKCLGKAMAAPNEKALSKALDDINDDIKNNSKNVEKKKNLFVICPDPKVKVNIYQGEQNFKDKNSFTQFTAGAGVSLPPGQYTAEVMLDPPFLFKDFVIPPLKRVTLKVEGKGALTVPFFDNLLDVEVLDEHRKVVQSFTSDETRILSTGVYDVRILAPPFFEQMENHFLISPGGNHTIKVGGVGVIQIDYPTTVGLHLYTTSEKLVGNYLTNFPFVIKEGSYRFFVNDQCNIEGINVRAEKVIKHLNCSLSTPHVVPGASATPTRK